MKRAAINIRISVHELKGNEMREVIPESEMRENGILIAQTIYIDGEDNHGILRKIREWIGSANG